MQFFVKTLGINTLINKNKDTSNWCRIISHWVHYCYSTQFLTFFVGFFFRQCVIQLPFLSKCGGNTSIKFQRREKTFFGTLVVPSLAYKYCRIIRMHLRNVPFIFYNLWKYFLVTLRKLNCQRIHFFLSFKKLYNLYNWHGS